MFLVFVLTLCAIGINANQSICDVCLRECSVFDTTLRQLREEIKENKKAIDGIKSGNAAVAFFAYLSQSLSLASVTKHQTIIYDSIDLNIGNGYDKTTGKFTTPSSGLYVFHVATGSLDKSHSIVELVVNNVVKDIGWADSMDHHDRAVSTTATPVSLNEGDVVLARIGELHGGNKIESNKYIRSSFSGFKLNSKLCDYS